MTAPQRPVHPAAGWTRTALRRAIGALRHFHEETMRGSEAVIFRPECTPRSPRADAPAAPPGREAPATKGAGRVA